MPPSKNTSNSSCCSTTTTSRHQGDKTTTRAKSCITTTTATPTKRYEPNSGSKTLSTIKKRPNSNVSKVEITNQNYNNNSNTDSGGGCADTRRTNMVPTYANGYRYNVTVSEQIADHGESLEISKKSLDSDSKESSLTDLSNKCGQTKEYTNQRDSSPNNCDSMIVREQNVENNDIQDAYYLRSGSSKLSFFNSNVNDTLNTKPRYHSNISEDVDDSYRDDIENSQMEPDFSNNKIQPEEFHHSPLSHDVPNNFDDEEMATNTSVTNFVPNIVPQQFYYGNPFPVQPFAPCIKPQNYASIENLRSKMGYKIYQENGQRKFCSPEYDTIKLEKGCEIFIGKIPRDCFEDELVPILSTIGRIHELRLMMDFSGTTRGFGFVSYFNSDDAQKAVSELNNYEIRPGVFIGVCLSIDNCRLFIGGIPKFKTKQEIFDEMAKITDDVIDVIVYPSVNDKMKNRGFAFVEYQTHRAAAMARRRLIPGKISLWGSSVAVDWAEPELDVPRGIMSTVKILYVRNLMLFTTEDSLYNIFANAAECDISEIERVRKLRDFCFIHFTKRENALKAMEKINGTQIDGSTVEVSLAKPVDKTTQYYNRFHRMHHHHNHHHHNNNNNNNHYHPSHHMHHQNGNGAIFAAGHLPMSSGSAMYAKNHHNSYLNNPIRLFNGTSPNNRYPLTNTSNPLTEIYHPNHQPPMFRPQIVAGPGPLSDDSPQNLAPIGLDNEFLYYNITQQNSQRYPSLSNSTNTSNPSISNHFINGASLSPGSVPLPNNYNNNVGVTNSFFSCVKLLEDICYANNWGSPTYDLSIYTTDNSVFYSFHVNIPNLKQFYSKDLLASVDCNEFGTFLAKEFIAGLEEAKEMCAARIISCLDSLSQKSIVESSKSKNDAILSNNINPESEDCGNKKGILNTSDVLDSLDAVANRSKNPNDFNIEPNDDPTTILTATSENNTAISSNTAETLVNTKTLQQQQHHNYIAYQDKPHYNNCHLITEN